MAAGRNHQVPVRVLNPQDWKVIVRKGEQMALYAAVNVLKEPEGNTGRVRSIEVDDLEGEDWPEELKALEAAAQGLSEEGRRRLHGLMRKYRKIFAVKGEPVGRTDRVRHSINTMGAAPIKQRPQREPLGMEDVVKGG